MSEKSEFSVEPVKSGGLDIHIARELMEQAKSEGVSLAGAGGLLSRITKTVLEAALNAEMDSHFGYGKGDPAGRGTGNHRNGRSPKTVHTDIGAVQIDVPRDRNGEFEPQIVPKHARRIEGFDESAMSLFSKGLTTGEIQLPESINATWPRADVQQCVVHLVRASLKFSSRRYWGQITGQLKAIYTAPTVEAAETLFGEFRAEWEDKYPAMIAVWTNSWEQFIPFLKFPVAIRKLVYTTNAIESLNSRFRYAVRRRGHFPNEQAAMKVLYLVIRNPLKNRQNITGKISGWKDILNTLAMFYGERLTGN
ncbi:transposase [Nocardia sp. alder85J]|uniref:transposase n=1 Tax=Nocardia sp. alder85J TaxID=2862949 RepID=UPI002251604E|nr:transposase [Nocardia sp. alder85J]MCX4094582.1 transposase [Nocardia sp. alder85J]